MLKHKILYTVNERVSKNYGLKKVFNFVDNSYKRVTYI